MMDVSKGPVKIDHSHDKPLVGKGNVVCLMWAHRDGTVRCGECAPTYNGPLATPYWEVEAELTRAHYGRDEGCDSCHRTWVDWREPQAKGITMDERIKILEDQVEQMKKRWPGAFHQGQGFKGPGSF